MKAARKKKVAIIHCNDPKERNFVTRSGRKAEIWELTAAAIKKQGMDFRVHFPILDPDDFPAVDDQDAVIIPGSVYTPKKDFVERTGWMQRLCGFIRKSADAEKSLFGICFGHQAIGAAYGIYPVDFDDEVIAEAAFHKVKLSPEGQKDMLFCGIGREFMAILFHYSFLPGLPPDSVQLAEGDNCAIQAFRMLDHVWGVQFHTDYGIQNALQVIERYKPGWPRRLQERKLDIGHSDRDNLRVLDNFLRFVAKQ